MLPPPPHPTLITVSGASSRSGKTALAESLLAALPRHSALALKFTTTEDVFESCPRGTPCVVCDIDVPFRIVEDPRVLAEPGTDTARLGAAGARRVVWVISRQSAIAAAWAAAESRLDGVTVVEGSTIATRIEPALRFFVAHPFLSPGRWKPTSAELIARADALVVNRPRAESRPPSQAVLDALGRPARLADVRRPLAEWGPDLFTRLAELAASPAARPAETWRSLS